MATYLVSVLAFCSSWEQEPYKSKEEMGVDLLTLITNEPEASARTFWWPATWFASGVEPPARSSGMGIRPGTSDPRDDIGVAIFPFRSC